MPYIQNTAADHAEMLKAIGLKNVEELFSEIPKPIRSKDDLNLPEGLTEWEMTERVKALGAMNRPAGEGPFFLGAGIYNHFIPALVDNLAGRSEFVTAYTPYQPELSQGALQAFFEYQTMICLLTGLEISNASMYDGATALAEGVLMAIDGTKRKKVLVSKAVHPEYRAVLATYLGHLGVEILEIPHAEGSTPLEEIDKNLTKETAALVLQNPNFLGCLEDLEEAALLARKRGALSVVSVNPISLSVLKSPGECGVDIATGEGQSLGVPMSFGGPGFGFLACRMDRVRRLPGRVVGQTIDQKGNPAYVLTFQTREQHIRRERATSNICTNHALAAMRSLVYLAALGRTGFRRLGELVVNKSHEASNKVSAIPGFTLAFQTPFFQEFAVRCPVAASKVNAALLQKDIIGGYELGRDDPAMEDCLLLSVTETTTDQDVDRLVQVLKGIQ